MKKRLLLYFDYFPNYTEKEAINWFFTLQATIIINAALNDEKQFEYIKLKGLPIETSIVCAN